MAFKMGSRWPIPVIGLFMVGSCIAVAICVLREWRSPEADGAPGIQATIRRLQNIVMVVPWRATENHLLGPRSSKVNLARLGQVQGTILNNGVEQYLGIPYAEPPLGSLRFRPSQTPNHGWKGVWQATRFSASCIQAPGNTQYHNVSEDCLYVNVWAPKSRSSTPRAVLVWIHGGAFIAGSGQDYNGSYLASTGLSVVTFNYRLAGLGFYASSALAKEDKAFPSNGGMNGIGDQILALKWVHDHISQFGGDPTRVTLAGESSGGISVCYLMHVPAAKGLFHQAVAESGSCVITESSGLPYPESQAEGTSIGWALSFGCIPGLWTLDCMRKVPADRLTSKGAWFGLRPSIDGVVMPGDPYDLPLSTVPQAFVGGSTSLDTVCAPPWDDGSGTGPARTKPWPINCKDYKSKLSMIFGEDADAVELQYPCPDEASKLLVGQQWLKLSRDVSISCPVRWLADKFLAAGSNSSVRKSAYLYEFAYNPDPAWLGLATHGAELGYVWNSQEVGFYPNKNWNPELASSMSGYWSSFALGGEPKGVVAWPEYADNVDRFLRLDSNIKVFTSYHGVACNFWRTYLRQSGFEKVHSQRYKKMVNQCFN